MLLEENNSSYLIWFEEEAKQSPQGKLPMEICLGTQASGKALESGWEVWEWYLFINEKFSYKLIVVRPWAHDQLVHLLEYFTLNLLDLVFFPLVHLSHPRSSLRPDCIVTVFPLQL